MTCRFQAVACALVWALAIAPGCDTLETLGKDAVPVIGKCVGPVAMDLFPRVSAILAKGDTKAIGSDAAAALDDLAMTHGANIIACLVREFINQATRPGASADPAKRDAAARGEDYLRMRAEP